MSESSFAHSGEMVAATLRGYRSWKLSGGRGHSSTTFRHGFRTLQAVSADVVWESKFLTAICNRRGFNPYVAMMSPGQSNHKALDGTELPVPTSRCSCGIYGWYEPENAMRLHTGAVVGVVEFSGRIVMGTVGFRAEKARIVGITFGTSSRDSLLSVQQSLGILMHIEKYLNDQEIPGIEYKKLQRMLTEKEISERMEAATILKDVATKYEVEFFSDVERLKEAYPPQLDTVKNVIGDKLVTAKDRNGYHW